MGERKVVDVGEAQIRDLCRICVPPEKREDPAFVKGMENKGRWAMEMLERWGSFAKLGYDGPTPIGLVQYEPIPLERVVSIFCIYVPDREHWKKGTANHLLASLIEEMRRPQAWFNDQPARALVTRTFPGEKPDQYPARRFYEGKGFKRVGEDPDFLYFPLEAGYVYQPVSESIPQYIPQESDEGIALILHGPSSCPYDYSFLKMVEDHIKEIAPGIKIRWVDRFREPIEAEKRGIREGIIVNATPIQAFVLEKGAFQAEVRDALEGSKLEGET
jgi:RimJ/RimL family protein N-acetyltransferase